MRNKAASRDVNSISHYRCPFPERGKSESGFLPLSRQFTVGQLFLFPVFLAPVLLPGLSKVEQQELGISSCSPPTRKNLFSTVLGLRAWPSLTNGQLLLLV